MTHFPAADGEARPIGPPLPITIVPGMFVYDISELPKCEILGISSAYCIYRVAGSDRIRVSPWREVALANVCPVAQLLSEDVTENDRRNVAATALRELLCLKDFGPLSTAQSAALSELTQLLCSRS